MTNKLISLVVITFILSIGHSYSEDQFLFPKEKPSIFKKINISTEEFQDKFWKSKSAEILTY